MIPSPLVLLVDDDSDTREMYAMALQLDGFTVVAAANVAHAMHCVTRARPDVIVTDLGMPGADGYELMRRLDGIGKPGAPVIALTGWAGSDHATRARAAGCSAVCIKPCLPETLAAAIRAAIRTHVRTTDRHQLEHGSTAGMTSAV